MGSNHVEMQVLRKDGSTWSDDLDRSGQEQNERADSALAGTSLERSTDLGRSDSDVEKSGYNEKDALKDEGGAILQLDEAHGEDGPVIRTGKDISRYLVRFDDAGDPALTLRGFLLGNAFMIMNCAISYIYSLKPVQLGLSSVFVQLAIWLCGLAMARFLPGPESVAKWPKLQWLEPALRVINPGPFGIKEHVIATMLGTSGTNGSAATDVFVTMKLFYRVHVTPLMAIFGIFSISVMGIGMVGILRPLIVYPSEAVYYYTLPMVAIFQMLHYEEQGNRPRSFLYFFLGTCLWEPIVAYICLWLNGISIFCLASMNAPMRIRKHIARVFGGASPNQGMGYFSISLDPQYVSPSTYSAFPLKWQFNYWCGILTGGVIMLAIYYSGAFDSKQFPFLSRALFTPEGKSYPLDAVFGKTYEVHEDALDMYGPPHLTATAVWSFLCQTMAIGAMFSHVLLFMSRDIKQFWKEQRTSTHHDPHFLAMKRYPEVPAWWYHAIFVAAIVSALLTVTLSYTTLPWWGFIVALSVGVIITPFSAIIYSQFGSSVATNMFSKMLAGALHPGRPVANLFFAHFCHQVVATTVALGDYQKLAIYLKVPHRTTMLTQCYATVTGAFIGWGILTRIIENKREILLDPVGNNQWSGSYYMSLNSQAVEWALADKVFAVGTGYVIVPIGIFIGACIPVVHWLMANRFSIIRQAGDMITTPLFIAYLHELGNTLSSTVTSAIILGVVIQLYVRVKKPRIFREYFYLSAGAIDGAAQIVVVILSYCAFGGNGKPRPFPTWFGNPEGSPDHCVATNH